MRATVPILVVAGLLAGCGERSATRPERGPEAARHFERADRPPRAAPSPRGRHLTARVAQRTWLRASLNGRRLHRIGTRTEFGSPRVLAVVARRDGWLRVLAPELGNRQRAWIPERRAVLDGTSFSLHVDRSARRLVLRHRGRAVRSMPVAVGRPGNETPLGRFAVTDKLRPVGSESPYGCCALALNGHQTKLEPGWVGGDRLAIHGTPQPATIGRAASLGCMRARERDLEMLLRRVPLGAPVFIRA